MHGVNQSLVSCSSTVFTRHWKTNSPKNKSQSQWYVLRFYHCCSSEISELLENNTYSEWAIFTFTLGKYSTYPLHVYPLTWVPIHLNAHCTANIMKEPNQLIIKTFKETIYNRNLKKIKIQFKLNIRTFLPNLDKYITCWFCSWYQH